MKMPIQVTPVVRVEFECIDLPNNKVEVRYTPTPQTDSLIPEIEQCIHDAFGVERGGLWIFDPLTNQLVGYFNEPTDNVLE